MCIRLHYPKANSDTSLHLGRGGVGEIQPSVTVDSASWLPNIIAVTRAASPIEGWGKVLEATSVH